jgi:hypothetical protein
MTVAAEIVLDAGIDAGEESWADVDWLRADRAVAAIVARAERVVLPDGTTLETKDHAPEAVAIAVLASLAARAATLARSFGGPATVNGRGLLARFTRILLGLEDEEPDRPAVIVDTVGSAAAIGAAVHRLADMGALVLAAPTEATVSLDLYPDVHLRGLTVAGVPLLEHPSIEPAPAPDALARLARRTLGTSAMSEANGMPLWYRLDSRPDPGAAVPAGWDGATPNER